MSVIIKTRRDLIDQVLRNFDVLAPGQTSSAEEVSKVDAFIDPVIAELASREVIWSIPDAGEPGPSGGAIDVPIFLSLADVIAGRCAGSFNLAGDVTIAGKAQQGEDRLREIVRPASTHRTLGFDRALSMRGRTGGRERF